MGIDAAPGHDFLHDGKLGQVDLDSVMLDPSFLRIVLCEFPLRDRHDVLILIEKNRS